MSQQPPSYPYSSPQPGGHRASEDPTTGPVTLGPPPPNRGGPPRGAPTGTNTMAILSVVFAFVFSPLGIAFGVVGRRQTARTGQPGRGLATTGLALSAVFLVIGLAAAAYAIVLATQIVQYASTGVPDLPGVSEPADPVLPADPAEPPAPVATGPAGTATVGISEGDYGPEVPSDALAEQVGAQSRATDVVCPGYLPAQVEASTVCAGTVDGQQAQLQTRVSAVAGSEATVEITRVG